MSCWRITGICTVAKDAQNGHSKSEYSVTSTGAASQPSLNPRIQQLTRAVECLDTLGEGSQHRDQPLGSLRPVDFFFLVTHTSAFPTVRRLPDSPIPPSDYTTSRCRPRALSPLARLYYIAAPLTRAPRLQHERGVPLHGQKAFGAAQTTDPHLL